MFWTPQPPILAAATPEIDVKSLILAALGISLVSGIAIATEAARPTLSPAPSRNMAPWQPPENGTDGIPGSIPTQKPRTQPNYHLYNEPMPGQWGSG